MQMVVYLLWPESIYAQPPEGWTGGVGFVSKDMIESHCPSPAPDVQVDIHTPPRPPLSLPPPPKIRMLSTWEITMDDIWFGNYMWLTSHVIRVDSPSFVYESFLIIFKG